MVTITTAQHNAEARAYNIKAEKLLFEATVKPRMPNVSFEKYKRVQAYLRKQLGEK